MEHQKLIKKNFNSIYPMKNLYRTVYLISVGFAVLASLSSCRKNTDNPGTEYASQMYHSVPYEGLSQVTDPTRDDYNTNVNNPHKMNMREPAPGTIKINGYNPKVGAKPKEDLMIYNLTTDDFEGAAVTLENPIAKSDQVIEEGKALFESYCVHCHGATGQGDGEVGLVFKGVPSYSKGRVKEDKAGQIFHTITFGRNRMLSHASQVSVVDRWKIVHYVQTLQNQ